MDMVVWTCKTNQNKKSLYWYHFLITMCVVHCVPYFHILVTFVYAYMCSGPEQGGGGGNRDNSWLQFNGFIQSTEAPPLLHIHKA